MEYSTTHILRAATSYLPRSLGDIANSRGGDWVEAELHPLAESLPAQQLATNIYDFLAFQHPKAGVEAKTDGSLVFYGGTHTQAAVAQTLALMEQAQQGIAASQTVKIIPFAATQKEARVLRLEDAHPTTDTRMRVLSLEDARLAQALLATHMITATLPPLDDGSDWQVLIHAPENQAWAALQPHVEMMGGKLLLPADQKVGSASAFEAYFGDEGQHIL